MTCLMFKAVTDVYGYKYIYKYEYKCLWSKEINVKDLPVLLLLQAIPQYPTHLSEVALYLLPCKMETTTQIATMDVRGMD